MVRTGPDGALWVVDMYRYMIEHPQWLPQKGKDELRPYYRSGEQYGRIYRVVRSGGSPRPLPRFIEASPSELIATLSSPNGWRRDVAQRILVRTYRSHKGANAARQADVIEPLKELVTSGHSPLGRLHALCTLDGIDALDPKVLQAALADPP